MEQAGPFDEKAYWIKRHEQFRGDVRSVGNRTFSVEDNLKGQRQVREWLGVALAHLFPRTSGRRVLDLGCGVGMLAPVFVDRGFTYVGLDISPVAIEQARQSCPQAEFLVGDITNFRLPERFDFIIASYVLVHLVEDVDWLATLTNLAHALRDDGRFLLIDQLQESEAPPTSPHVRVRTLPSYRERLPEAGLRFVDGWPATRDALALPALTFHLIERLDAVSRTRS